MKFKKNLYITLPLAFLVLLGIGLDHSRINNTLNKNTAVNPVPAQNAAVKVQSSAAQPVNTDEVIADNKTLLSQDAASSEADKKAEENRLNLENQIKAYLGNNLSKVGISYYDINTGKEININDDQTFLAASTVKVQMNMVLFDMVQSGQLNINDTLQYTSDDYEDGTGVLQGQDLSKPLPITLLSQYSIIHSDNIATNMIINKIGYDNMRTAIDEKLGHATDHSDNYITPSDETALLKMLYNGASTNPNYKTIIDDMKSTDFHDRIDLYVPQNIVAHKIGDYDNYVNDVGIIYTPKPYILSIYTDETPNASEVIAHISKMIYDYQLQS